MLYVYTAGTSTPVALYSDVALTTPLSNPVAADSAGRFPELFQTPDTSIKLILKNSAEVTIWSADNISAIPAPQPFDGEWVNDFRLTLTSGLPVTTADVMAATSLYLTPLTGNRLDLPDAAGLPVRVTSAEVLIAIPASTSQMYDVFLYNNAGVVTIELVAWANDTTRITAVVRTTTGRPYKSGDVTRMYVGSLRTTAVSGQTEDSATKRFLANFYHARPRRLFRAETAGSWTYATASWRQVNANTANQVEWVTGIEEAPISLGCVTQGSHGTPGTLIGGAFGVDSVTGPSGISLGATFYAQVANVAMTNVCVGEAYLGIGRHYAAWIEYGAVGTTTFNGNAVPTGMRGMVWG